jgi:hypothetical protein
MVPPLPSLSTTLRIRAQVSPPLAMRLRDIWRWLAKAQRQAGWRSHARDDHRKRMLAEEIFKTEEIAGRLPSNLELQGGCRPSID